MEFLSGWFGPAASVMALSVLVVTCLALVLSGWGLTLLGMPGNWLIAIVALGYEFLAPEATRLELGRWCVISLFVLAVIGEALETLTSAMGVARKGGSRRGAFGALSGSIVGGIAGAMVGLPIPVLGPVVAAVLFAAIGSLVGAFFAEKSTGKDLRQSADIGFAAMWGRIFGSLAKSIVGAVMVVLVIVAMLF